MTKPRLLLILPGLNEEEQLESSARQLCGYASQHLEADYDWCILLGDSGSTDSTPAIQARLVQEDPRFLKHREELRGRGRLLKAVWRKVPFDIAVYIDMDLPTDLGHIKPLSDAVRAGADLAVGTRLAPGAAVVGRRPFREVTSRGYVLLVRLLAGSWLTDFQCGFKAISKTAATRLVPLIENDNWFLDTELLLLAEKAGFKIHEEPVHWTDDPGSTVHVWKAALEDIEGLRRVLSRRPWEQLLPAGQRRPVTLFDAFARPAQAAAAFVAKWSRPGP